jgi:hypothetical protein
MFQVLGGVFAEGFDSFSKLLGIGSFAVYLEYVAVHVRGVAFEGFVCV